MKTFFISLKLQRLQTPTDRWFGFIEFLLSLKSLLLSFIPRRSRMELWERKSQQAKHCRVHLIPLIKSKSDAGRWRSFHSSKRKKEKRRNYHPDWLFCLCPSLSLASLRWCRLLRPGGLMDTLPGTLDPRKWRSSVSYGLSQGRLDRYGGQQGSPLVQSSVGPPAARSLAPASLVFVLFLLCCLSFTSSLPQSSPSRKCSDGRLSPDLLPSRGLDYTLVTSTEMPNNSQCCKIMVLD